MMNPNLHRAYLEIRKNHGPIFQPEFLDYLFHFIFRASLKGKDFQHLSVTDICQTFPRQLQQDFGSRADLVLKEWRIFDFAQIGKAIFLLAEQGCFQLNGQDRLEEYAAAGPLSLE